MPAVPGPRTHPTVKPLVSMNRKSLSNWEISLGPAHVMILLGVVTGSMACAFYLGFFSGREAGFDDAQTAHIAGAVQLPITDSSSARASLDEDAVSDVYAKLNDDSANSQKSEIGESAKGSESAQLALLKELPDSDTNIRGGSKKEQKTAVNALDRDAALVPLESDDHAISNSVNEPLLDEKTVAQKLAADDAKTIKGMRVLGEADQGATSANSGTTLGSLVKAEAETNRLEKQLDKSIKLKSPEASSVKATESKSAQLEQVKTQAKADKLEKDQAQAAKLIKGPTLVTGVVPRGWFAQVAAPRKLADANALAKSLKASGFPVVIEDAHVRGEQYFRVLVGPEDSRDRAERLLGQLKRERSIKGDPFLRMVK